MRKLLSTLLDTLGSCCFSLSDALSPLEMPLEAQERLSVGMQEILDRQAYDRAKMIETEFAFVCTHMLLHRHEMRLH